MGFESFWKGKQEADRVYQETVATLQQEYKKAAAEPRSEYDQKVEALTANFETEQAAAIAARQEINAQYDEENKEDIEEFNKISQEIAQEGIEAVLGLFFGADKVAPSVETPGVTIEDLSTEASDEE